MNKAALSLLALVLVVAAVLVAKHEYGRPPTTTSTTTTTTTTPPSTTTTMAALTSCSGADFSGVMQPAQGAAGTIYATVVLTNESAEPCSVNGWPSLVLLNGSGAVMSSIIKQSSSLFQGMSNVPSAPSTVTVPAHGTVQFALVYSDVPVGDQTVCPTVVSFTVNLPSSPAAADGVTVAGGSSFAPCGNSLVWVSPFYG